MDIKEDVLAVFKNPNNPNNKFQLVEQNNVFSKYEHIDNFPTDFSNPFGKSKLYLYVFIEQSDKNMIKESKIINDYSVFSNEFLQNNKNFLLSISIYR